MLTGTFRADGSSKFQKKNKWGYFPSAAVAWDVAKENFMSKQNIVQQLKLRAVLVLLVIKVSVLTQHWVCWLLQIMTVMVAMQSIPVIGLEISLHRM